MSEQRAETFPVNTSSFVRLDRRVSHSAFRDSICVHESIQVSVAPLVDLLLRLCKLSLQLNTQRKLVGAENTRCPHRLDVERLLLSELLDNLLLQPLLSFVGRRSTNDLEAALFIAHFLKLVGLIRKCRFRKRAHQAYNRSTCFFNSSF